MVVGGASNLPFSKPSTMAEPTETLIFGGILCSVFMFLLLGWNGWLFYEPDVDFS